MIPYQCRGCDNHVKVRNGRTNGSERILKACEQCDSVTTHEKITDVSKEDMSAIEREYLRQEYPEVLVSTESNTGKHYHIPSTTGKCCYRQVNTRKVSVDTYPLGYWDWCQSCLEEIRA